jgi:hypothetical protein
MTWVVERQQILVERELLNCSNVGTFVDPLDRFHAEVISLAV